MTERSELHRIVWVLPWSNDVERSGRLGLFHASCGPSPSAKVLMAMMAKTVCRIGMMALRRNVLSRYIGVEGKAAREAHFFARNEWMLGK